MVAKLLTLQHNIYIYISREREGLSNRSTKRWTWLQPCLRARAPLIFQHVRGLKSEILVRFFLGKLFKIRLSTALCTQTLKNQEQMTSSQIDFNERILLVRASNILSSARCVTSVQISLWVTCLGNLKRWESNDSEEFWRTVFAIPLEKYEDAPAICIDVFAQVCVSAVEIPWQICMHHQITCHTPPMLYETHLPFVWQILRWFFGDRGHGSTPEWLEGKSMGHGDKMVLKWT